jgi:hypothetical protein
MALQPNFTLCLDKGCSTFTFTDTTGTYNEILNPGGYGAPNGTVETIDSATILFEFNGLSITKTFTLSSTPVIEDLTGIEFTAEDLGTAIIDGVYDLTYTVAYSGSFYTKKQQMFFACNAECCIYKMSTKVTLDDCSCDNPALNNFLNAYTYLQVLKNAARAGQNTKFTNTLTLLNKLCTASGCGCGCSGGC